MAKTLKDIEKKISKAKKEIEKINKKEEKDGSLSNVDAGTRSTYKNMLKELEAEKENILNGGSKTIIPAQPKKVGNTPSANSSASVSKTPATNNNTLEKSLEKVEEKATETADEMNSEEAKNKKT